MPRAISQNIAWILAFLLSSVIFAVVLSFVKLVGSKKPDASSHHAAAHAPEPGVGAEHASTPETSTKAHHPAHEKAAPEKPAQAHHDGEEEEISADSFKKPKDSGAAGSSADHGHEPAPH